MQRSLIFPLRHKGISNAKRQGFTLVELVTVIIILGILVLGVSSFLIFGTRIFIDSTSVEQVMSQSRFAIERMTRDIRNAVPNSIRIAVPNSIRIADGTRNNGHAWQCIEMVPITSSSSYITAPIAPLPAANTAVVMQGHDAVLTAGQFLLIYPLSPADVYSAGKLFKIKSVTLNAATNASTVEFNVPVQFAEASPRQRYFGVTGAVSYCFEGITSELSVLKRYSGYGFNQSQRGPDEMVEGVLMAENVVNTIAADNPMAYTPGTLQNNAMVQLNPLFDIQGQSLQYHHQVQVINVP
ncbi:prepilin-type N-terminal cleavage/methylation domain-containing protein [Shewanella gelidimarina]|uniref:PilW family protein n=1 Tax=Shewanella gelidimarina TaxID=56813 RepID=UPI00200E57A7|nr:prepilin-type N-terminal cleavage/methylation domain-containing protein [Shewanella gelidimarina]MCL1057134.1 prepilin-type N-terminal cleavage/methylation domain-containing protein [Shewanella gelidimarina]